jgi:hypothetical protein
MFAHLPAGFKNEFTKNKENDGYNVSRKVDGRPVLQSQVNA